MSRCDNCIYKDRFQDMGASFDVCKLYNDLGKAAFACENSNSCDKCLTLKELKIVYKKYTKIKEILNGDSND